MIQVWNLQNFEKILWVKLDGFFYMGRSFRFLFSWKVCATFALLKYVLKVNSSQRLKFTEIWENFVSEIGWIFAWVEIFEFFFCGKFAVHLRFSNMLSKLNQFKSWNLQNFWKIIEKSLRSFWAAHICIQNCFRTKFKIYKILR